MAVRERQVELAGSETDSGSRRDGLIDVAIRVISEKGLASMTFRTLAEQAGTSTMSFSYAFGNRDGLIDAVIERVYSRTWRERGLDRNDDAEDPLEKLWLAARVALQDGEEIDPFQRTLDRFVIEAPYSVATKKRVDELDTRIEGRYLDLLALCREQGLIEPRLDDDDLVIMIWSLADGLNIQRYAYPDQFEPARMLRLFSDGFRGLLGLQPGDRLP